MPADPDDPQPRFTEANFAGTFVLYVDPEAALSRMESVTDDRFEPGDGWESLDAAGMPARIRSWPLNDVACRAQLAEWTVRRIGFARLEVDCV